MLIYTSIMPCHADLVVIELHSAEILFLLNVWLNLENVTYNWLFKDAFLTLIIFSNNIYDISASSRFLVNELIPLVSASKICIYAQFPIFAEIF